MRTKITLLLTGLLVVALASSLVWGEECCTAPENREGSVDWPPEGCQFATSKSTLMLSENDGQVQAHTDFIVDSFFDITTELGGSLGGEIIRFRANLTLDIIGSSGKDGWARHIVLPVDVEVHSAPMDATTKDGSWDTEMVSLSLSGGDLFGDPDFDLLRVKAGSAFGLPSPGQTTLTRLGPPGSDFQVDSFFDITYQIDFEGAPGSVLEGLAGTTIGTVNISTCPTTADTEKVVKFSQVPLNGEPLATGVDFPYYGHDELSTAYSWHDYRNGGTPDVVVGYKGCFMADDFADKFDTPVVCVKWWGSYINNQRIQPIDKFLIVFEEDVPADPVGGFSHPGAVLSSQIVYLGSTTDPDALTGGQYIETHIGDGGMPCYEGLYEYVAVLRQPFEQKPDTVYWIKIVALVDLSPQESGDLEGCIEGGTPVSLSLCEFMHLSREERLAICPGYQPITEWGWHNRDYRVFNAQASTAANVVPGENNQKDMFPTDPFETDVWHFQDDSVSGNVFTDPTRPLDPDVCPDCLFVEQDGFQPENYVYDKLCQQAGAIWGVDGPRGIENFSKDLAFVLQTTQQVHEEDCNGNGIPDSQDIANGTSDDCNNNGIPDECENDCNCNGIDDALDITAGTSRDCNGNGIPDECEDDCNGNGVPDDCDINDGTSKDCNANGIPDECEDDCNGNGVPDDCDIADGTSDDDNNNGIPDECEPPCAKPRVYTCIAGNADNFDTSDGSEPTDPSLYLLNNPGYCYSGALTQFDILPTNTCFIHTFDNCCWPANWKVVSASLEICLKGGTFITWTDSLHFKQNGTNLWGISLNNLISWQTSGADTFWNPGQSECFTLDLSNLPLGGTDILADLQSGFLDVVVADDTGVDYMILTVTVCPCEYQGDDEDTAGIPDSFVLPTETATPGPILQTFLTCAAGTKNFDSMAPDRCFGHTFTGISDKLLTAQLEIRLKAAFNGAVCNDTISLQATTLGPPSFAWNRRIGTAGPYSWCAGAPGLLAAPWLSGSDQTFTLNLAALPNADGSTTCIIPLLIQDGRLDVRVADDTAVDYMILTTTTCCRKVIQKLGPVDVNNDLSVNFLDISEVGLKWLETAVFPDVSEPNDPVPPTPK